MLHLGAQTWFGTLCAPARAATSRPSSKVAVTFAGTPGACPQGDSVVDNDGFGAVGLVVVGGAGSPGVVAAPAFSNP